MNRYELRTWSEAKECTTFIIRCNEFYWAAEQLFITWEWWHICRQIWPQRCQSHHKLHSLLPYAQLVWQYHLNYICERRDVVFIAITRCIDSERRSAHGLSLLACLKSIEPWRISRDQKYLHKTRGFPLLYYFYRKDLYKYLMKNTLS